jgi:hypothetical protein
MSIAGTWQLSQTIDGQTFPTVFAENGTLTVAAPPPMGPFSGTWSVNGSTVQFAIMAADGSSATLYQGTLSAGGDSMSGSQRSLNQTGVMCSGTWNASTGTPTSPQVS